MMMQHSPTHEERMCGNFGNGQVPSKTSATAATATTTPIAEGVNSKQGSHPRIVGPRAWMNRFGTGCRQKKKRDEMDQHTDDGQSMTEQTEMHSAETATNQTTN
mmetsp:Transcript_2535/g.6866  ORF Transcript_2535/g.6866 Transcript_2535/m.6866 type:complete len:104 (+) Transcript_2535:2064-2375(+)